MIEKPPGGCYLFDAPATYQIQIQGRLGANWSERLESMAICERVADDGLPVTTLNGELADQAALVGVLNQLYNLRMAVLSVTLINAAHD